MRTFVAAIAIVSMCGFMYAQDEKNAFDKLKDAMGQKDASAVKTLEPAAYKFAESTINAPKPSDPEAAKNWSANVEAGKEMVTYTEYALATMTATPGTDPATAAALGEMLLAQNPKSQYVDEVFSNAMLNALRGSAAKQMAAMATIDKSHPDNITANVALIQGGRGSLVNAEHLIAAAKKPRPESVPEASWEKLKNEALANGYFFAGKVNGQKGSWRDCDNNLSAALPLISGERLEEAYFDLGICEFKFGQLTLDRTKMQSGQQYMQKAASLKGPYQGQAYTQAAAMKQALGR